VKGKQNWEGGCYTLLTCVLHRFDKQHHLLCWKWSTRSCLQKYKTWRVSLFKQYP